VPKGFGYGSGPTGNPYVCGNTSGTPTIYQIPITAIAMAATSNRVLPVSNATSACSPVTEVYSATPAAAGGDKRPGD